MQRPHQKQQQPQIPPSRPNARHDAIHRALLTGLLGNIGQKGEQYEYTGARGTKFAIFPGSALFKAKPPWLMSAELVETTKLYGRTNARIRPEWIERAGEHLVKKTYSEPHWSAPSAHVVAFEKVTLYGLVIVPRRSVHYGPIDPRTSREIFIHHALVEMDYKSGAASFTHNRDLLDHVRRLEAKARRNDLLADPSKRFAFYNARVPADVYNGPLFEQWRREAEKEKPDLLHMQLSDVVLPEGAAVTPDVYPDELQIGDVRLPLDYHYEPGHLHDGVTARVPLVALNQMPSQPFEWLIPGYLREKIDYLIRSLPKALRVQFVPVPEYADKAMAALLPGPLPATGVYAPPAVSLVQALAGFLGKISGVTIRPQDFQADDMPAWLRMDFRVVDSQGNGVTAGRDLAEIRRALGVRAKQAFATLPSNEWNREQLTRWDFGDLPERVEIRHQGMTLAGYPALVDEASSAALRLFDSPEAAAASTRPGLRRLFMVQLKKEIEYLQRTFPNIDQLSLYYAPLGKGGRLKEQIAQAVADRALFENGPYVRTREEFIERGESGWRHLSAAATEIAEITTPTLTTYHELSRQLSSPAPPLLMASVQEIRKQLAALVPADFLTVTPFEWLVHLPRYVKALQVRYAKLMNAGASRDMQAMNEVWPHEERYEERSAKHRAHGIIDPELERYRWMLEEFRVSLFAQELKTAIPISAKRLDAQWEKVRP
jgi:ATP-dependent helicase HrpA